LVIFFVSLSKLNCIYSSGEDWKFHRRLVTPAFHAQVLEKYVYTFNSVTNVLIKILDEKVGDKFDIHPYINLCALDIITGKQNLFLFSKFDFLQHNNIMMV